MRMLPPGGISHCCRIRQPFQWPERSKRPSMRSLRHCRMLVSGIRQPLGSIRASSSRCQFVSLHRPRIVASVVSGDGCRDEQRNGYYCYIAHNVYYVKLWKAVQKAGMRLAVPPARPLQGHPALGTTRKKAAPSRRRSPAGHHLLDNRDGWQADVKGSPASQSARFVT